MFSHRRIHQQLALLRSAGSRAFRLWKRLSSIYLVYSVVVTAFVCWLTDVVTVASNIALVKADVLLTEQPHQSRDRFKSKSANQLLD